MKRFTWQIPRTHVSSSGLSRGSSLRRASALADGWMVGTSPTMTIALGIHAKHAATGEIVTTWEVRASGTTEVKR